MRYSRSTISAMILAAAGWLATAAGMPANASTYTLQGVTFELDEPGTATGQFGLTIYGYSASASVTTTTTGGWPGPQDYTGLVIVGSPPASEFILGSIGNPWELVLDFTRSLAPAVTGKIGLVPGAGTPGDYSGSYEICSYASPLCDGVITGSARLITAGAVLTPEPGAAGWFATGVLTLALLRRRSPFRPDRAPDRAVGAPVVLPWSNPAIGSPPPRCARSG